MQDNIFKDYFMQTVLTYSLKSGVSMYSIMQTVIDAYAFQKEQEELRELQPVFDFIVQFDGLTEMLINQLREKFIDPNYALIATEINKVIFGYHKLGIRQLATEKELNKLKEFEKMLAYALRSGFLKTESELIEHIQSNLK